ncbi:MAG TPA: ligase-associated DNA damage response exonuclease [Casimicrobiaceae bacterium]|nr:ligase-associated DNA damage response exonuclease [Casimicrobiaceae bacterium]
MNGLLSMTEAGLHCPAGGFFVDPWQPVDRALITHAHADHARGGSRAYLGAAPGLPLLRARLPEDATIETIGYGEVRRIGDVDVSFHPAGHVLGSAQIRIARGGRSIVVSGDYKLAPDPSCEAFEPVRCDTFVTESTFGLPIYRWKSPETLMREIAAWWQANRDQGFASVVFAYALGKAQRIAAGLAALGDLPGPIACHGAVARINDAYRDAGVVLPPMARVADAPASTDWRGTLVLAPPSAQGSAWLARFDPCRTAAASGWMAIRGTRRRANLDRGFVLSDHADWPALNDAVAASGASEVVVTHGYRDELVRWLTETRPGLHAEALATRFEGEQGAAAPAEPGADGA